LFCRIIKLSIMRKGGQLGAEQHNWVRAGRLSEEVYQGMVASGTGLPQPQPVRRRSQSSFLPGISMIATPWKTESDGTRSRLVMNAANVVETGEACAPATV
jgi:hypothetical protein